MIITKEMQCILMIVIFKINRALFQQGIQKIMNNKTSTTKLIRTLTLKIIKKYNLIKDKKKK